ncbi:MAG: choice-of-anchor D domain-containing protein, partial [Candidatus Kapaibacterium sp.]
MRNFQLFFASFLCVALISAQKLSAQLDRYLILSEDTAQFDVSCGQSQCQDILLRNISSGPLRILSLTSPQTPFSISAVPAFNTPVTVSAGAIVTLQFCFSPTIPGLIGSQNNLVLTVDTGDAANLARDTLVLTGLSRSAAVDFNPTEINFGGIVLNKQTCQQVTISNSGNEPIALSEILPVGAPYSISPAITGTLSPGASITVDICFLPTVEGLYPDTLRLANGACRRPADLVINGAGMNLAPDIGPILQLSPPLLDFDTTRCGTTKCRNITIRNVGSSTTVISDADQIIAPFSGAFPSLPISLPPDSSITINVCYSPPDAPRIDTQLVRFTADSRYSLTIATVFDASGSMDEKFGADSTIKRQAARDAGVEFLKNLIRDTLRAVVDTAAVYRFSDIGDFARLAGYTTDPVVLQNSVPDTAISLTCLWDALLRTIVELQRENLPGRRVIVVLTDGENSCFVGSRAQAIAAANAAGVRIYTIGIGDLPPQALNDLDNVAAQTRGRSFLASDAASLLDVYKQISEDLSKSAAGYLILRGEGAAPILQMTPSTIDYDSVRVDSSRCLNVQLTNVGNAPYPGGPLVGIDPPFATATPIAPPLLPGESTTIEICFGPDRLRIRRDTVLLPYVSCAEDSLAAELVGVGYDSVVVEMRDVYTGRPGSIFDIPVYLLDPMPDLYEVDSLRVQIKFIKTM